MTVTPNSLPRRIPSAEPPRKPLHRRRNERKRFRVVAAQLDAAKLLHSDADGRCAFCDVPSPCPTNEIFRIASMAAREPHDVDRAGAAKLVDTVIRALHRVPVDRPPFTITKGTQK